MRNYKVAIIGGGVSGMIAAIKIGGKDTVLIEAGTWVGKKLLSTGNGKCNLLNKRLGKEFYNAPDFVAPAFDKYDLEAISGFYEGLGLLLRYDAEGRGYPASESATTVLDILRRALQQSKVDILCDNRVIKVVKENNGFRLLTKSGELTADKVLIATGSDAGFGISDNDNIFRGLVETVSCTPSLAPICTESEPIRGLNGIRVKCSATLVADGQAVARERGEILFKAFALSGIAIFNLSAVYARLKPREAYISLNLLNMPVAEVEQLISTRIDGKKTADDVLAGMFHKMLQMAVLKYANMRPDTVLTPAHARVLATVIADYRVKVQKSADKSLAQVMNGGVSLSCVNKNTLESKDVMGLYFAGEALDIDGLSGGYNLMWAAASAMLAADSLA